MMRTTRNIGFALCVLVAAPLAAGCAGGPGKASTGEHLDDAVITSKVKTELFRDPAVSGFAVDVETFKGKVQLSGFVDSAEQKSRAGDIAKKTAGVKAVANNLIVKPKS